jgi:hypothetical protein
MSPPTARRSRAPLAIALAMLVALVTLPAAPSSLAAQDPAANQAQVDAQMAMMAPMMSQMMQSMMQGMLLQLAKPETAQHLAAFSKNYFDALVAKGFTRDEALRIVVSVGMPTMPGMK